MAPERVTKMIPNESRSVNKRSRSMFILVGLALVSTLYSMLQRSPWALFSHRADDFALGVAFGSALVLAIAWFANRGERHRKI